MQAGWTDMLQIRYRNIEKILQLLRHAQKLHNTFRLLAKMAVQGQGLGGINVRHLEIVF